MKSQEEDGGDTQFIINYFLVIFALYGIAKALGWM